MDKSFLKCMTLGLFMLLSSMSWAQDAASMPSKTDLEKRIENTVEDLKLNEEQATQFRAIENQYIDDRKATMESASDRYEGRAKVKELSDAKMEKLKALLTPEQFKIYKNLAPKRGEGRKKGKHKKGKAESKDGGDNR